MSRPSILCGTDFTAASEEALRLAIEETRRRDAILDVIHVWFPIDPIPVDMSGLGLPVYDAELPTELRNELESLSIDLPADRVRRHLETGQASEEIVRKAEQLGSELLVVGTHSRGSLARWFIGSVVTELLRLAPCPILVCRTPHPPNQDKSSSST